MNLTQQDFTFKDNEPICIIDSVGYIKLVCYNYTGTS